MGFKTNARFPKHWHHNNETSQSIPRCQSFQKLMLNLVGFVRCYQTYLYFEMFVNPHNHEILCSRFYHFSIVKKFIGNTKYFPGSNIKVNNHKTFMSRKLSFPKTKRLSTARISFPIKTVLYIKLTIFCVYQ